MNRRRFHYETIFHAHTGGLVAIVRRNHSQRGQLDTPEPFEVMSADASRVFRFEPGEDPWGGASIAAAGVYSNTEPPELIYAVEGLRAWAYRNQFYFSEDLTHFAFVPSCIC